MNITRKELQVVKWSHLSPRNAEIMARWECGEVYSDIAKVMRNVTKNIICGIVRRNRDDGHVVKPRGPLLVARSLAIPNKTYDESCTRHTAPIGFRQHEIEMAAESRARLIAALEVS